MNSWTNFELNTTFLTTHDTFRPGLTRAQSDVEACYAFIAKRSPQGAATWFNRFAETEID